MNREIPIDQYKAFVNDASIGFFVTHLSGKILFVNPFVLKLSKYQSFDVVYKMNIREIYRYPEERDCLVEMVKVQRQVMNYGTEFIDANGEIRQVIINAHLDGEQITGNFWDVTEVKQIRESLAYTEHRLQALLDISPEAIVVTSLDGTINFASKRTARMHGYTSEEMVGMNALDFVYPDDRDAVKKAMKKSVNEASNSAAPVRMVKKDGSVFLTETNSSVLTDLYGQPKWVIAVGRDVTDRIKIEQELRESRKELMLEKKSIEKLVEKRTKELFKVKEEIIQAKRLSDIGTLAATVAHELRRPLNVIGVAAYNIKRKCQRCKIEHHVENIEKKIAESALIINNLLSYSRIKLPHLEEVNLASLILESMQPFFQRLNNSKSTLISDLDAIKNLKIHADPYQLKAVFGNILNNAYQALSENEGKIKVSSKLKDHNVELIINDNGEGITKPDLKQVFKPFFTRKSKGTGLGLSIASELIKNHQGTISIESQRRKGTIVTIVLPCNLSK